MRSAAEVGFIHALLCDLLNSEKAWPTGLDEEADRTGVEIVRDSLYWVLQSADRTQMARNLNHIQEAMQRIWRRASAEPSPAPVPDAAAVEQALESLRHCLNFLSRTHGAFCLAADFEGTARDSQAFLLGMSLALRWSLGQDDGAFEEHLRLLRETGLDEADALREDAALAGRLQ